MTSTEIARASHPAPGGALSLGAMTPRDAWIFAETLADSPLLPDAYRKQPASVLWALEYGRALGLDVVTTITTIHVIKGKPTQSADLMLGRARSAGHRVRIKPERDRCVVSIVRFDDPDDETVIDWTLDDAVTAGLCTLKDGKPWSRSSKGEPQSWEKYPRAMLRSRAIAEAVRTCCPEVLHGAIYTPEELGAYVDQDGSPVEAPVQQLRVVDHVEVQRVEPEAPEVSRAAQELADRGAKCQHRGEARPLWPLGKTGHLMESPIVAPDTGELDQLGFYLTRLLKALPEAPAEGKEVIHDAEIVPDDELTVRANAIKALHEVATEVGLTNGELEEGFQTAYGTPVVEGTLANVLAMTATLRPAA